MLNNNSIGILSTGHYLPDQHVSNQDFVSRGLDTSDEWISSRSGIKTRFIAAEDETTSDLAYKSAQHALDNGSITLDQIDFIIVATATADHNGFPSTACLVQQKLGCTREIPAFDISAACSGFAYALSIGQSYIASGMATHGLIIGAETLSSIVDWSDRSTCVLFGDGAGAAIIGPVSNQGIIGVNQGANGNASHILSVEPKDSSEDFYKKHHNYPRDIVHMDGPAVFKQGIRCVEQSLKSLLKDHQLSISDISYFVAHQANLRILNSIASKFNIPFDRFLTNIESVGNTSAASIPIVLSECNSKQLFQKNDIICLLGFGAGFTWSSVILEWS